ncbi:M56 family metallopeptidase [Pedobacter frigiditerrae]|uniref:M56 family metallopeptidase n=1 Tax=Pedobacter frigiditerrae TaxID=2530452 RepID=A0A4R0N2Y6_9SPHI|nr:M56 family metallopeptidase [Pedobacter frigiditerrae]TCC93683.1 M56 family metallopeptidase [Pedobacter frigiditerrae]
MIFYALNVALILAGCFLFYKVLLQKETFFPLNRFVLLGCLFLSFSLPLIPVPQQWSFRKANIEVSIFESKTKIQSSEQAVNSKTTQTVQAGSSKENNTKESFFKDVSLLDVVVWAYWLGVAVFGINFLFQLCILLYKSYSRPFIQDGRFRIVELSGEQAPCSFANNIFINPEKYDWDTYNQIILHEKIHIQQGHSYDIILAELALIFQWFNPFAWFYRKAMEDNLEFLTDNELLSHSDIEPTSYQMSLVKVSAPNFPASLTTNYNQSILKKRLLMMNSKKSNINSTWKYLCIVPLLLVCVSLFNEPVAFGKSTKTNAKNNNKFMQISNKGTWFATIKNDKINIRFEDEEGNNNYSNSEFLLSEFKNLPTAEKGTFSLTRDAGTIQFIGKFDGNAGMGNYEFKVDDNFFNFLEKEGVTANKEKDGMVFYMIKLKKDFIAMLKKQGYTQFSKNDLIPLCAMKVTGEYIASLKNAGLDNLSLQDIIPLKALNVDAAFIKDIKSSGYKNITASKLITLKAQGIDGEFLRNAKNASDKEMAPTRVKSPKINTRTDHKTNGDDEDDELGMAIAKKAMNITAEFVKTFTAAGFKFTDEELLGMKSLGITPEYCKSFEDLGLGKLDSEDLLGMKALGITAADYNEYKKLGFKNLTVENVVSAKATGTTPTYIAEMKKKGHNYSSIEKYVEKKVVLGL